MIQLFLDENLEGIAMVLEAIADNERTFAEAVASDVYFIYTDEPDSTPTFLATITAGQTARVPFNGDTREIRLFAISKDATSKAHTNEFAKAQTITFNGW
jgi:hypothetical protein